MDSHPRLRPADGEVARILEPSVEMLLDPASFGRRTLIRDGRPLEVPVFLVDGQRDLGSNRDGDRGVSDAFGLARSVEWVDLTVAPSDELVALEINTTHLGKSIARFRDVLNNAAASQPRDIMMRFPVRRRRHSTTNT